MPTYVNTWSPSSKYYNKDNPKLGVQNPNKSAKQIGLEPYKNKREARLAWRNDGGTNDIRKNYSYRTSQGGTGNVAADYLAQKQRIQTSRSRSSSSSRQRTSGATTPATSTPYTYAGGQSGRSTVRRDYGAVTGTTVPTTTTTTAHDHASAARRALQDGWKAKQSQYGHDHTLPTDTSDFDPHAAALEKMRATRELADKSYADGQAHREKRWQQLQANFAQNESSIRQSNEAVLQRLRERTAERKSEIDRSTDSNKTRQTQYLAGKNALMSSLGQGSLDTIDREGERLKSEVESTYLNHVADIHTQEQSAISNLRNGLQQELLAIDQADFTSLEARDAAVLQAYNTAISELATIRKEAEDARITAEQAAAEQLASEAKIARETAWKDRDYELNVSKALQNSLDASQKFAHFATGRDGSVVGIRGDGSAVNFGGIGKPQTSGSSKPYMPSSYKEYLFELENSLLPAGVQNYEDYRFFKEYGVAPNTDLSGLFDAASGADTTDDMQPAARSWFSNWLSR